MILLRAGRQIVSALSYTRCKSSKSGAFMPIRRIVIGYDWLFGCLRAAQKSYFGPWQNGDEEGGKLV